MKKKEYVNEVLLLENVRVTEEIATRMSEINVVVAWVC